MQENIGQVQNFQEQNLVTSVPEAKKAKPLLIFIALLLLLIVVAGSVFAGMKIGERRGTGLTSISTPTPEETPTADPTVDWKTYTNEILKYTLKVPRDWEINTKPVAFINLPGEATFTPASEMGIEIAAFRTKMAVVAMTTEKVRYSLNTTAQFNEWLDKEVSTGEGERLFKIGNEKLNGYEAVKFVNRTLPGDATELFYSQVVWVNINGTNYYLELGGDEKKVKSLSPVFDQILSTFRFN